MFFSISAWFVEERTVYRQVSENDFLYQRIGIQTPIFYVCITPQPVDDTADYPRFVG